MRVFAAYYADDIEQRKNLCYSFRLERNAERLNLPLETYLKLREGRIRALVLANPLFVNHKLQQRPLSASFQQYADLKPDYLYNQMIFAFRTLDQCVGKSNDIASPLFRATSPDRSIAINKAARALNKLTAATPDTTETDQETLRTFAKIRQRNTILRQQLTRR